MCKQQVSTILSYCNDFQWKSITCVLIVVWRMRLELQHNLCKYLDMHMQIKVIVFCTDSNNNAYGQQWFCYMLVASQRVQNAASFCDAFSQTKMKPFLLVCTMPCESGGSRRDNEAESHHVQNAPRLCTALYNANVQTLFLLCSSHGGSDGWRLECQTASKLNKTTYWYCTALSWSILQW